MDETYVLATHHYDKHTSYVAMSRHREDVKVYAARPEFFTMEGVKTRLSRKLERYSTLDFAEYLASPWQRIEEAYMKRQRAHTGEGVQKRKRD